MYCLYCGDCCRRMSPIANPCPKTITNDNFHFCSTYDRRPKECVNHEYPARFCPIGLDVLKLRYPQDTEEIRERIDTGWELIKQNFRNCHNNEEPRDCDTTAQHGTPAGKSA